MIELGHESTESHPRAKVSSTTDGRITRGYVFRMPPVYVLDVEFVCT